MARHTHKWVFLLLWIAGLSACNHSQPSQRDVYQAVRLKFEHGDLLAAQREADQAYQQYAKISPDWAGRFRVLQAEVLLWRGGREKTLGMCFAEMTTGVFPPGAAARPEKHQGLD